MKTVVDNEFIKQYQDLIYSEIRSRGVLNSDVINHLFSLVIIRVLETITNYDPKKGKLSTWLVNQTRSVVSNHIKSRVRSHDAMDNSISISDELSGVNLLEVLEEEPDDGGLAYDMIFESGVSREGKEYLYMYYIAGYTVSEISAIKKINRKTVMNKLEAYLNQLQQEYRLMDTKIKNENP